MREVGEVGKKRGVICTRGSKVVVEGTGEREGEGERMGERGEERRILYLTACRPTW